MTVEDFITAFRSELGDNAAPYLWSDEDIVRYLNEAVDEACERAKLIEDSTSADCCEVTLVANQASYPLHASVLHVKRVAINGRRLELTSIEAMDEAYGGNWEARVANVPHAVVVSDDARSLRFFPVPTQAGTATLRIYRTPLEPLSVDADQSEPEIRSVYHPRLKNWVYRCAYLKDDAETFDRNKANDFEARFVADFGERPDANVQRKRRDRRPPRVRFNPSW
jgi:hypothetical protein